MASLDFPASPSNLDEFTSGDVTWQYNSTKGYWTVVNNGVGGPRGFTGSAGVTSIVDNAASTVMTLAANSNIGIGTTSPISLLHLQSAGQVILTLEADTDNATETDNARIEFIQDGGLVSGRVGYANNTNSIEVWNEYTSDIVFGTSDVERMRIYSDGTVEFKNAIAENVYTATAGAIFTLNPSNGTIQNLTLSASCEFNDGLDAGEYITLHILDGTAYTITWPTMEWIGGSAPTLDTTNETIINVWKVGSVLYGALVGVSS